MAGRPFRLVFAAALLVASGCGGQEEKKSEGEHAVKPAGAAQPSPARPIGAEVKGINAARSCTSFVPLTFSIIRQRPPGAPPSQAECKSFAKANRGAKPVVFDKSAAYGTAALLEGPAARGGAGNRKSVALWALDADRRFRYVGVEGQGPRQIGTHPRATANAAENAAAFVAAVRRRDCGRLAPLLAPSGRLVTGGTPRDGCKVVLGGKLFAPALKQSPGARPVELGGTRSFAFYGVSTKKAYFTLLLQAAPGDDRTAMKVLDVLPNTPVALPPS